MQRSQLEHLIRAAAEITNQYLPRGWQDRLVRLQTAATNGRVAYCLDPVDLFVSKACAAREKDGVFNRALLAHGIVQPADALTRAALLDDPSEAQRAAAWIRRLAAPSPGA